MVRLVLIVLLLIPMDAVFGVGFERLLEEGGLEFPVHQVALDNLIKLTHGEHPVHHHPHKVKSKSQQCGGWQPEYSAFHRNAVSSLSPSSRMLIFKTPNSGVADRLAGLLTGFYAALLSKRVFFLSDWWTWGNVHVRLTDALERQHINWTLPLRFEDQVQRDNTSYTMLDYINTDPLFSPKGDANKTRTDTELILSNLSSRIVFQSNRANIYTLLKNPPPALAAAKDLGVLPQNGVYCAFHYLFKPRPEVVELLRPHVHVLHDDNIIKIGIHIRTGDHGFSFYTRLEVDSDPYYGKFFECAADIEKRILAGKGAGAGAEQQQQQQTTTASAHPPPSPAPRVVWYLISDNLALKQSAAKKYGDKLLWTTHEPMHIGINNDVNDLAKHGPQSVQIAVADVLSLSKCDYFVLSHDSGLGKIAALLSTHTPHDGRVYSTSQSGCRPLSDTEMAESNQGARL